MTLSIFGLGSLVRVRQDLPSDTLPRILLKKGTALSSGRGLDTSATSPINLLLQVDYIKTMIQRRMVSGKLPPRFVGNPKLMLK